MSRERWPWTATCTPSRGRVSATTPGGCEICASSTTGSGFSCQFGEQLAFNATRVEILGFAATGGHAWYQGQCRPLKTLRIDVDWDPSGRWGRRVRISMEVEGEISLDLEAVTEINLPVHVTTEGRSACVNEGLAQYRWNGRVAPGIAEFMGQVAP